MDPTATAEAEDGRSPAASKRFDTTRRSQNKDDSSKQLTKQELKNEKDLEQIKDDAEEEATEMEGIDE